MSGLVRVSNSMSGEFIIFFANPLSSLFCLSVNMISKYLVEEKELSNLLQWLILGGEKSLLLLYILTPLRPLFQKVGRSLK